MDLVQNEEDRASVGAGLGAGREPEVQPAEDERSGERGAFRSERGDRQSHEERPPARDQSLDVETPVRGRQQLYERRDEHDLGEPGGRRPEEFRVAA